MEKSNADIFVTQFNETIDKWIGYLDSYNLEMLYQRPAAVEWSLGQVYLHIIADTQFYIEQAKTALLTGDNSDKNMNENGRTIFGNNAFPDMRLVNPFNSPDMRQPESKQKLFHNLTDIKNKVNELYATVDFATSIGKTEHPGFLFFSVLEWLRFAEMHMRHNLRQKRGFMKNCSVMHQRFRLNNTLIIMALATEKLRPQYLRRRVSSKLLTSFVKL